MVMQLTEDIVRSPAAPCLAYPQYSGVGEVAAVHGGTLATYSVSTEAKPIEGRR